MEDEDVQQPGPPKGATLVSSPPKGATLVTPEKKSTDGTPHDFGMGYKPSAQDLKEKKTWDDDPHVNAINVAQVQRRNPKPPAPKKDEESITDKISNALYLPSFNQGVNELLVKPLAGATDFIDRTIDKAYTSITGQKTPQWLREGGAFKNLSSDLDKAYQGREKPKGLPGQVAEGVMGAVPLMASLFTGEGEVSLAAKAPQFVSKATKLLATTKAASAYHDATKSGAGYGESLKQAAGGAVKGAEEGLVLDAQMLLGGALGKGVANKLAEKGLLTGKTGEALTHALATGTVFGATPVVQDLIGGKDVDMSEAAKNFGMGLVFEAIPVAKGLNDDIQGKIEEGKVNTQAAQNAVMATTASNLHGESVLRTLMETPKDQLQQINENIKESHEDLYAKSIEQGMKAYDEKNPSEKKALVADQLLLKTQGDVKFIANKDNNELLNAVNESHELEPEQKQDLIDKINTLKPTGNEKENQEDVGQRSPITSNSQEEANQTSDNNVEGQANEAQKEKSDVTPTGEVKAEPVKNKREQKIPVSEAPDIKELSRNMPEVGKPGIAIEPSFEREYGTNKLTDKELDNGNKYVVSRDRDGKVNGALEISYNGENGLEREPTDVKVAVSPESRRKGIATALFKHAEENGIDLSKIRGTATTDEGQALYEANLKLKDNATKIESAGKMDVGEQARDGETVGKGNAEEQPTAKQGEEKTTGIKKAISESTRIEHKLPEVKLNKLGSDHEVLANGKRLVEKGDIRPEQVAKDIIDKPRTYTPEETDAMLYYGHQLTQQEATLREAVNETHDPVLHSNLQQLNDAIDAKTQADRINSREWSNLGNRMQIEADQNFSPASIRSVIRENYGGKIPKEVEDRIKTAETERDKAIADLKKATENQIKTEGAKTVEKIRKSIKLVKQSKAELQAEASDLVKQLQAALKKDSNRMNAGIPLPTETLAVLGKLAVNYFKQGVKDFEGLANKIYDDLKETGVKKDDIREYLSNYEPLHEEAKETEAKRLGAKERSLNKQLETGNIRDYSRKPKIVFKKDNDIIRAEQRVADAEYELKQEKARSYKATEKGYQRGLNWIIRWERRSVLASPMILEKLASAATIGAAVNRIPKQLIGGAYGAIFKGLRDKAMIEGGLNMNAELKFWKEFTDPKKFAKNAVEILKTGASPLTRKYTEQAHDHYAGYDALMDLHAIIKDPPKRATFEASMRYATEWAAEHDLDYTDPLIKRSLELAAFKRAEYEIFQENSGIAKRVNDFINSERKRTDVEATKKFLYRFLIPISTVPLNIARRIGSSVVGLPHGLYLTREAYKKGIDNLTPEQADYILRQVKNGSVGLAYFTIGMFASKAIMGGVWNKDDRKGKTSTPGQAGFNEMKPFGVPIDKRIQHAMPLFLMQLGATTARVYNHYTDVPTDSPEFQQMLKNTAKAMAATTGAVVDEIPMVQEPVQAVEALSDPYERTKFGEDLKRRVGFSIAQDLGITKKDTQTPLDKKLAKVTNEEGDKVDLSTSQVKQRKAVFDKAMTENKSDWTAEFDDDWNNDKNQKARDKLSTYWHGIGRSDKYIKDKFADMKAEKLNQYLEKQAVEYSEDEIVPTLGEGKKTKNSYSIQ